MPPRVLASFCVLVIETVASAVTITVDDEMLMPGASFSVELAIASGPFENPASLLFDIAIDPAVMSFDSVAIGSAAMDADKQLSMNLLDEGTLRIIISGLNALAIPDGALMTAFLELSLDAPNGFHSVALENVMVSERDAFPLPVEALGGAIEVYGAVAEEGEGEGDTEGLSEGESEGEGEGESEGSGDGEGDAEGDGEGNVGSGCAAGGDAGAGGVWFGDGLALLGCLLGLIGWGGLLGGAKRSFGGRGNDRRHTLRN